MQNVILVVHLILALCLIGVVLLQRSEGGGLGMGGGGGGVMSGRGAATALAKLTWGFAVAFIATSVTLTILAARDSGSGSVLDRVSDQPAQVEQTLPEADPTDLLPPVATDGTAPAQPPRAE